MLAYLAAMWKCRYFWLALVHSDLRSRYRGSVLGLGWSMLHPLAMTVILCSVFVSLFEMEVSFFAPFLLCGLALWQFVSSCCISGSGCFIQGEAYIRQYPAPMAIYPLRVVLGAGFHSCISLLVAILGTCYFLHVPNLSSLLSLVPTVVLILLLGWSLAILFGLANVAFRDTQHLTEVGLQGLFYLTPIFYPLEKFESRVQFLWLLKWNPLTPFLDLIREPLLKNTVPPLAVYQMAFLVVLAFGVLAAACLARQERRIIFQL